MGGSRLIERVRRMWDEHPLFIIVLIALVPRIVAALVSRGYGMHDDHFGPIEQPFIIMQYPTYWTGRVVPHGHSIVYPSLQYLLFNLSESVGLYDPQGKMILVRLLHAAYSLLVVVFGFKIARAMSTVETAKKVGLLLALFWALPFLSVRNLIEVVCIPPLMAGMYYALISSSSLRNAFTAGLWLGLAFAFRYQTLLVTGTIGLVFLFRYEYRQTFWCALGFLLSALVVQGSADIFAWGYPFASFAEYVRYNLAHGEEYTTGPWYNYILLVVGVLLPPLSFFLIFGFIRSWKKLSLIVVPVLVFFILHSYFPNKQERFILPILPALMVAGIIGWEEFVSRSGYWSRHRRLLRGIWISFWILNTLLLIPFTTYYGKKSRVEAMGALYGNSPTGLILVGGTVGTSQPPLFYSGKYPVNTYEVNTDENLRDLRSELALSPQHISHVAFFGTDSLDARVQQVTRELGLRLHYERMSEPSFLDIVFHRLNPRHNKNETIIVYSVLSR